MNKEKHILKNIPIPSPIHAELKIHAAINHRKLQEVVEEALSSYLNENSSGNPTNLDLS